MTMEGLFSDINGIALHYFVLKGFPSNLLLWLCCSLPNLMEIFYVDSDIICSADNMHLLKENALIYSKSSTSFDYWEKLKSVPIIIMVIIRHLFAFGLIIRQFPCYTMSYQKHVSGYLVSWKIYNAVTWIDMLSLLFNNFISRWRP